MKDFTRIRKPIEFTIDNDRFDAVSAIPAHVLMDMTTEFQAMDEGDPNEAIQAMMKVLELFLMPASYTRFTDRMKDKQEPIEFPQVQEVIFWLLEEYGMRPTQQSSDSSDGLSGQEPGTNSTATSPVVESISLPSPLISS
jgi:hypothetical protein